MLGNMLGKRLRRFREISGLTQQQVADVLNLDRSTYAYYETGKTTPDINSVTKLLKLFGISYYDLIDEEEPNFEVNDSANDEDSIYIYELSKIERTLIINFRLLNLDQKEELIAKLTSTNEKKVRPRRRPRPIPSKNSSGDANN